MKISNLNKTFGNKNVFDNKSFDFPDGKITYLMGESGKGKTTLLRIISGLDKDFTGTVDNIGKISYVFQEPRLFPALTVTENIEIVNDNPEISASELISIVELEGYENYRVFELSGGMKSRVSLARAIYYNADLILMDEPFASLDFEMKTRIIPKIISLLKNKTVIIVSHDVDEAKMYSDNIVKI